MKTYQCTGCGHQLQRPTQPLKCPQCGRQAIGLFRALAAGAQPAAPQAPQPSQPAAPQSPLAPYSASPPGQVYAPRPAHPSQGPAPVPHGGVSPIGAPPPPPPPGSPSPLQTPQPPLPPVAPTAWPSPPAQIVAPQPGQQPAVPQQTVCAPEAGAPVAPAHYQPPPQQPLPQSPTQQPAVQPSPHAPTPVQQPPAERPAAEAPRPAAPQQFPPAGSKPRAAPPPLPAGAKPPAGQPPSPRAPRAGPPPTPKGRAQRPPQPRAAAPAPPPKLAPPKPKPKVRPTVLRPKEFVWAWPPEPPFEDEARAMRNAPAVDPQGRVILYCQGRLVALTEEEGTAKVVWEYVIGSPVPGPVTVAADGTIRAHCADGYLHCLNAAGRQEWSPVRVGEPLGYAAPVVDEQGNTYVSAYGGGLLKVDREGRPASRAYFRSRRKLDSAAVIREGVLYVGSEDGYVFAVRLGEGRGEGLWDHAAEQGRTGWYVNGSPAIAADGAIVVAARDEHLYGFHPDGQPAWATRMPGQMLGSPVIDRHGHLYVGVFQTFRGQEGRGFLVSVDGNSHKLRWRYDAAGEVESTPVIGDDDLVYFGDNSGTVHAVDFEGKSRWTAKVESAVRSAAAIIAPARLAVGLDDDTLVVLRCTAGGLAGEGWPKVGRTPGQGGLV